MTTDHERSEGMQPLDEPTEIIKAIDGGGALTQINAAEVNVMIATAKRFPRSIAAFQKRLMELATLDEETAGSMFYSLPRGGKPIEGESIRFAEAAASAWGNLHFGARGLGADEKWVHAQGVAWDLETNNRVFIEASRRITDKYGRRYNDDMVGVTSQAAISVALRNAVFRVIPKALCKRAYEEARLTSIGKAMTMEQRRAKALELFAKMGVVPERIFAAVERKGVEDLTVEDLMELRGLFTAIKDGQVSIEEAFPAATTKPDEKPKTLADLTASQPTTGAKPGVANDEKPAEGSGLFAEGEKGAAAKAKK
mgnify:CR=1 FL=1